MDNQGIDKVRLERMSNAIQKNRTLTLNGTLVAIQLHILYKAIFGLDHIVRRCHPTLLDNFQRLGVDKFTRRPIPLLKRFKNWKVLYNELNMVVSNIATCHL